MNTRKIVTVIVFLIAHNLLGQSSQLDKFDFYRTHALQEKIYLHLDQNFYLVGESIWFKIYCVDGSFHKPLDISKVAYIELLDRTNSQILQTKVKLENGFGNGSVFLPATIQSGNYKIRCYTQWMRNFEADFFFEKQITIVNPFVPLETAKLSKSNTKVQFFPEGGQLVNGLESKVGFKISSDEQAIDGLWGAIVNESNDTIATFKPLKFGLGSFVFTPEANQKYTAILVDANGTRSRHTVPEALDTGYVLRLADSNTAKISLTVTSKFSNSDAVNSIYFIAHARNIVAKAEMRYLETGKTTFTLDSESLPEGISHFTFFDDQGRPICERLYFKQPQKQLLLKASTDQQYYGNRKKIQLRIASSVNSKNKAPDNISVAVYKADSLSNKSDVNIYNYLWLLSDLTGKIDSAEYYFQEDTRQVREASDNLMLTHGWRRFKWETILTGKPDLKFVPEYRGQIVSATISNGENLLAYLSVPGKPPKLFPARATSVGEVTFEIGDLTGVNKAIFQASNPDAKIEIHSPFSTAFSSTVLPQFTTLSAAKKDFVSRAVAMQVQDIYYEDSSASSAPVIPQDTIPFYGPADETYYLDAYTRFPVMEEVMREYVPGVFVRKNKDGFYFIVIDAVNGGVFDQDPMILLDGTPLFDADKIMAVDPRKIRKLDVIKRKYYLGPSTMAGIVSYTSYNGDMAGIDLDPGVVKVNYDGLQAKREFYSPEYKTQQQYNNRMPDRRFMLYWNPSVSTINGIAELEFYTSDVKGTFRVIAEGLNGDGYAGSSTTTFVVK